MMRAPRFRLSARLALAIALAVLASFAFDQMLRTLIPPPPFLIMQRAWLIETVAQLATPDRDTRQAGQFLETSIVPAPQFGDGGTAESLAQGLKADLGVALGVPSHDIRIGADLFSENFWERSARTAAVIVPALPSMLTAKDFASSHSSVLGRLDIAVRRPDGSWVVTTPRRTGDTGWHYMRNLMSIAGNLLILAIFSIWMARSIVAPLRRLADAAEQLGHRREPTLVTGMHQPEFAAIAEQFNAMQLRLKGYVDERIQMLAAISHDLRTPLTRLRLLAEYVPDAEQRAQLDVNLAEMEAMIADALAFMRGEAQREPVETVDIAALLISLADTRRDIGEAVDYAGPDHLDIRCRPRAMRRALDNLIANACRYGEAAQIHLVADDADVIIEIRDRGPGIAPEDADRAFTPFVRLDASRSRDTGGVGLGLAISRDVVRGHGGDIAFDRSADDFTVRVVLPSGVARGHDLKTERPA